MTASVLTKKQVLKFGPKTISYYGKPSIMTVKVQYDDEWSNGHNTFAITADIRPIKGRDGEAGGCLHDEIAEHFPELAHLIKWHLVSSDGSMHYIANTVYHASARDYRGLLKGEKRQLVNGRSKLPVWQRVMRNGDGIEITAGSTDWRDSAQAPKEALTAAWEPVWIIGEGKAVELDHARSCAVWPDATDEELTAPGLADRLKARHPALMAEFQKVIEDLGLVF